MRFLLRFLVKAVLYYAVLITFAGLGLLPLLAPLPILFAALILAAVNTIIRPVIVAIALPFNIITLGIASVFANLLTLVIANGIGGGTVTASFWAMLLVAFVIMLVDDCVRIVRQAVRTRKVTE